MQIYYVWRAPESRRALVDGIASRGRGEEARASNRKAGRDSEQNTKGPSRIEDREEKSGAEQKRREDR